MLVFKTVEMRGNLQGKKKANTSQVFSSHLHGNKAITVLERVECKANTEGCPYSVKIKRICLESLGQLPRERRRVEVIM